jgi:thymidylate kinase
MKLLIIEGPDRCGKNTLIQKFLEQAENSVVRHWGSAKGETDADKKIHQYKFFEKEFRLALLRDQFAMPDKVRYPKDIWIWNRAHLGEFVYGTLYRNTQPRDWVFPMEKRFGFDTDPSIYLVLLTAPPNFLCKRDDGESFSAKEINKITELRRFDAAFEESGIVNKLRLDVTKDGEYKSKDEIFDAVNKFVFG